MSLEMDTLSRVRSKIKNQGKVLKNNNKDG